MAHLYLRNHEEAAEWGAKAIRLPGVQWPGHCAYIAALAHLDRLDDTKQAVKDLLSFRPDVSLAFVSRQLPTIIDEDLQHMLAGLRKGGLPK